MKAAELKRKARENEGMTVEEIIAYEKLVKPKVQVYGKYGSLAKKYLEEVLYVIEDSRLVYPQ